MSPRNKGQVSTPDNPGRSPLMAWIRDHLSYSGDDCLTWPFGRDRNGYGSTVRRGKKVLAHRYICTIVHGEPPTPKHHAAHSCGKGHEGCVNPRHLSWKTNSENQLDRHQHGTNAKSRTKLTPEQVDEIRSLKGAESTGVTAARFGISEATARHIQSGRARPPGKEPPRVLTAEQVQQIRTMGGSNAAVGRQFGVARNVIWRIRHGRTYKHVGSISGD
jgi:DNA-binding transcriptional regulator YiaG